MRFAVLACLAAAFFAWPGAPAAHHSFAVYDMTKEVAFEGVVETLKYRNPHMAMTLAHTKADGSTEIVNFIEGAPKNMLLQMGLLEEMIKPGTKLKAIGAPRKDNPNAYFLKAIVLENGLRFDVLRRNSGQ